MTEVRLSAGMEASALLARAQASGGFGTVLKRGDAERGSLMLVLAERGSTRFVLQRLLQGNGTYDWEAQEIADSTALDQQLAKARNRDPDLWVIELDVPSAKQFIAEMS